MQTLKYVRADYLMYHFPDIHKQVQEVARDNRAIFTLKRCLSVICSYYGVTPEELKSRSRMQRLAVPRHHFCWVVYRNRLDVSYPMIGRFLGKDHTTIVHSVSKFEEIKHVYGVHVAEVDRLIRINALTVNTN
jgi:chromosomal replication initiator protein